MSATGNDCWIGMVLDQANHSPGMANGSAFSPERTRNSAVASDRLRRVGLMLVNVLSLLTTMESSEIWVQLATMISVGVLTYLVVLAAISWRRLEEDFQWLFSSKIDAAEVPADGAKPESA